MGSPDGVEKNLVQRAGLPFRAIRTGQLRGTNPLTALVNAGKMMVGVQQSLVLLDQFRPDVCLVTGGYVCAPVTIACRLCQVPVLIYLPDMSPGMAIRVLSRLAQRVAVSFPEVANYFGAKAVVTGYPVRQELVDAMVDQVQARQRLARALESDTLAVASIAAGPAEEANPGEGTGEELPLLLVFGGSQGARSLNQATWAVLPDLLPYAHILHVVGTRDWEMLPEQRPPLPQALARRYHAVAYLHAEMSWALAAADLVVARAGASTLAEFPIARLPAVLVPLPIAGGHQWINAEKLASQGGAVIVQDEELASQLAPTVQALLQDPERRGQMGAAMATLARPQAALQIAREVVDLGRQRTQ